MVKQKFGQNMSDNEKTSLRNLVHAKHESIISNDNTDKNVGAADADKNTYHFNMSDNWGMFKLIKSISQK